MKKGTIFIFTPIRRDSWTHLSFKRQEMGQKTLSDLCAVRYM
jgi:hypothetical protein